MGDPTVTSFDHIINCNRQEIHSVSLSALHSKLMSNVPLNLLKSVCIQNFLCATVYQHLSIFRTTCIKQCATHVF